MMHSRRRFVGIVGGGLAATLTGRSLALPRLDAHVVRFFDVVHDPAVLVWMSDGDPFRVVVKDAQTGDELESFEGVTAWNLLDLRSDHVQVVERT